MFSFLISHRAMFRRPRCVYLEKQNKIVCIIRSATRATLEGSPAGSFRWQRAPVTVDPCPRPQHGWIVRGGQQQHLPTRMASAGPVHVPCPPCKMQTGFSPEPKQRACLAARSHPLPVRRVSNGHQLPIPTSLAPSSLCKGCHRDAVLPHPSQLVPTAPEQDVFWLCQCGDLPSSPAGCRQSHSAPTRPS